MIPFIMGLKTKKKKKKKKEGQVVHVEIQTLCRESYYGIDYGDD